MFLCLGSVYNSGAGNHDGITGSRFLLGANISICGIDKARDGGARGEFWEGR